MTHETMQRVFHAVGHNSTTQIAKKIGKPPQTINNWVHRGLSKSGALLISNAYGLDINWILTGKGEMTEIQFDNTQFNNANIDNILLNQAIAITNLDKDQTIETALQFFINMHAQENIRALRGKLDWENDLA